MGALEGVPPVAGASHKIMHCYGPFLEVRCFLEGALTGARDLVKGRSAEWHFVIRWWRQGLRPLSVPCAKLSSPQVQERLCAWLAAAFDEERVGLRPEIKYVGEPWPE